jgi:Fe-S cluster biogenesis protein NfuA
VIGKHERGGWSLKEDVIKALEGIRPHLQRDGGDVELVAIEGDVVKVRLKGACGGCPMSQMTLKNGIERHVKAQVKGVRSVEAV